LAFDIVGLATLHQIELTFKLATERMLEKARKLVESGRIEQLAEGTYNVIGDHGTYTVVKNYIGKVSCNCPGFGTKGQCSHAAAVMILTMSPNRRRRKPL
jgi:uncharacterized Zn finger protein